MPLIDLPLAELHTYAGRNPRPADYDFYWAEALRELDATDPSPELRPSNVIAPPNVECFDLWFTGVGGARIYAKYLLGILAAGTVAPAGGIALMLGWLMLGLSSLTKDN